MAYYQVTNQSTDDYDDGNLELAAGATTTLNLPQLPIEMHAGIVSEQLIVVNLGNELGSVGGDVTTDVIATNIPALLTSQIIVPVQVNRLPPGAHITNNTPGNVGLKASAIQDATFSNADEILEPGEACYIAADYVDAVKAICEIAEGFIAVKVFY